MNAIRRLCALQNKGVLSGVLGAFVLMVFSQGCASIVAGNKSVRIMSTPTDALITVTDKDGAQIYTGKTVPGGTKISLPSPGKGWFASNEYKVKFTKVGCRDCEYTIERGLSGWYLVGNLFFGGLIGYIVVDPLTGAMWSFKDLNVTLKNVGSASLPGDGRPQVMTLDQMPQSLRSQLLRIN
jgi:hypothetical protein